MGALKCAMKAAESMHIKMVALALCIPFALVVLSAGCSGVGMSVSKGLFVMVYASVAYRTAIASAMYPITMTPRREKGAREARFFRRDSGSMTSEVTESSITDRSRELNRGKD